MSNTHKNKKVVQKRLAALPSKQKQSSVFSQIREFIYNEDFADDAKAILGKDLSGAVGDLKTSAGAKDFQQGANAGKDDGDENDDVIEFTQASVPCTKMFPTQAEIGFTDSLDNLIKDQFNMIDLVFAGGSVIMGSKTGPTPVLTAEISGKIAILDGHHRWSTCFMIDPKAKMSCDVMSMPSESDPATALKVMQFAIAAKAKKVVTKPFGGEDLMKVSTKEVVDYVKNGIVDTAVAKFKKYKPEIFQNSTDDKQAIAEYVGQSHILIKKMKGMFPRIIMPQAGDSGTSQKTVNQALSAGDININEPFVKENNMNKKAHKQLAAIKEWLITGKTLNELTFTSAGIPELIQLIYDKQKELVPKLGFKSMTDILSFIMYGDQEEQAELVNKLQALKVPGSDKLIKEEAAIRQLIRKIIREGEAGLPKEEEPAPEPKEEKPEPVEDEPGLDPELVELTDLYVKKLKNAQATIDQTSTSEILSSVLDSFGYGNNDKLTILQAVKNLTVR